MGDVVVVRALTDSATYNQLELPTGRLAKINPGDVLVGVLGSRRALKGFVGDVPETVGRGRPPAPAQHGRRHRLLHGAPLESLSDAIEVEVMGFVVRRGAGRVRNIADGALALRETSAAKVARRSLSSRARA